MDIGKTKENFDKDRRPKCFNYNIYRHIVNDCQRPKKKQDIRKCYKYDKMGHITKNCRSG